MGLRVRTRSGEVLQQDLRYPLMSEEEIQQKFRKLVGLRLDSEKVADLERKLKAVESMDSVAPLVGEMEVAY
jgi:hypothetical protein